MRLVAVIYVGFLFACFSESYDLSLDTVNNVNMWTISGSYFYTPQVEDVEGFLPTLTPIHSRLTSAREKPYEMNPGIWFTKHISGGRNVLRFSYKLFHALFLQGWIKFLAEPSVNLVVKAGTNNKQLGIFRSDGKSWCDAVVHVGHESSITVEVETPGKNDYFLLDKIVMGVFSNVSQLEQPSRKLNPCREMKTLLRNEEGLESQGTSDPSEENKRTGGMDVSGIELEGSGSESRGNLSTSSTNIADATLAELEKFLAEEDPKPVSRRSSNPAGASRLSRGRFESDEVRRKSTMNDDTRNVIMGSSPTTRDFVPHLAPDTNTKTTTTTTNTTITNTPTHSSQSQTSQDDVNCSCACSCSKRT